jgi:hypothetical protein
MDDYKSISTDYRPQQLTENKENIGGSKMSLKRKGAINTQLLLSTANIYKNRKMDTSLLPNSQIDNNNKTLHQSSSLSSSSSSSSSHKNNNKENNNNQQKQQQKQPSMIPSSSSFGITTQQQQASLFSYTNGK